MEQKKFSKSRGQNDFGISNQLCALDIFSHVYEEPNYSHRFIFRSNLEKIFLFSKYRFLFLLELRTGKNVDEYEHLPFCKISTKSTRETELR